VGQQVVLFEDEDYPIKPIRRFSPGGYGTASVRAITSISENRNEPRKV